MKPKPSLIPLSALLVAIGCASSVLFAEETVGEKFRKVLADIDAECRKEKWGPYLDPGDPEYHRKRRGTDCDILKLEPRDWRTEKMVRTEGQLYPVPERWLATPEGRFAHSIKLPAPHDKPKDVYRPGMTGQEYFEALCNQGAGEFIFRTATGVRGVRQDRTWIPSPNGYVGIVFWTREKGGLSDKPQNQLVQPPLGAYDFLEVGLPEAVANPSSASVLVYYRDKNASRKRDFSATTDTGRIVTVPYIVSEKVSSRAEARYGYTWRGIWPGSAMEHGIEGFEIIAYQRDPFEVFGYQRMFWRHVPLSSQRDVRMTHSEACPVAKTMKVPHQFIQIVLIPADRREE